MVKIEQYEYLRLRDAAVCVNQRVNFYGVVKEYNQPKRTRGSDLLCIMTIEDMSFNGPGLRVLVFSSTLETLPLVRSVGDVIRFHRVTVNIHNGVPQAIARMRRGASFLLFDGADGIGHTPYQTSSATYSMQEYDCQILDLIRSWTKSQPVTIGANDYLVSISGIKEGIYFDLCCKVLVLAHGDSDQVVILHVWDGTDGPTSYRNVQLDAEGREVQENPAETRTSTINSLSRDIMRSFPPLGTVLAVVPDIPPEELPLRLPAPGSWVKFRNLTCRVQAGLYEAVFGHGSKISSLSENCELVKKCERSYAERIMNDDGCLPQWAPRPLQPITVTDYEHVPFSTLREILIHPQVTFKFRTVVRVIAMMPSVVQDVCVPLWSVDAKGLHDTPGSEARSKYMYRIMLTLEDPTARVHAFLCGDDADRFFNGYPAANFESHSATVGALQRKVNKLLGFEEGSFYGSAKSERRYDPPWIRCCLKSYYLDKQNPWDSRHFRVFGTIML